MSKENNWAEERAFYREYGFIQCKTNFMAWRLSTFMAYEEWNNPGLMYRIPPKIQALIDELDALKKLGELRQDAAMESHHQKMAQELKAKQAYITELEKERRALLDGNKKLQSKLSKFEGQKVATPLMNNLIDQMCEQSLLTGAVTVKIMTDNKIKEDLTQTFYQTDAPTLLNRICSAQNTVADDLVHRPIPTLEEAAAMRANKELEALFDQYACAALMGLLAGYGTEHQEVQDGAIRFAKGMLKKRADALKQLKNDLTHQPKKEDV